MMEMMEMLSTVRDRPGFRQAHSAEETAQQRLVGPLLAGLWNLDVHIIVVLRQQSPTIIGRYCVDGSNMRHVRRCRDLESLATTPNATRLAEAEPRNSAGTAFHPLLLLRSAAPVLRIGQSSTNKCVMDCLGAKDSGQSQKRPSSNTKLQDCQQQRN
jgi:hypothetical protein